MSTLSLSHTERCRWSDLIESACAHCRGLTLDLPTPRPIVAKHPGLCATCEVPFDVGDSVIYQKGNYLCPECALL